MKMYSDPDYQQAYQANPLLPGAVAETEVELAGPWLRMGAYMLNGLLSLAVLLPTLVPLWPGLVASGFNLASLNPDDVNLSAVGGGFLLTLPLILLLTVWQCVWMSQRGQSIGKRLLGIKVIDIHGHNPGFVGTVLLREVVYGLLVMVFAFVLGAIYGFALGFGGHLDKLDSHSYVFDLIGHLPTLVCTVMLFRTATLRRTLQDYLAKTLVVKAR